MNILPLFRSHHSIGLSILTLEEIRPRFDPEKEIPDNASISIFEIAKKHSLDTLFVYERDCSGLIKAQKNADKYGLDLHYGLELKIQGSSHWHRIGIWLHETAGYAQYCRLITAAKTKVDFNLADLREYWSEYFTLTIPFYDSFLYNNYLRLNCLESLDFAGLNPIFFIENHGLPVDEILKVKVESYCEFNKFSMIPSHNILYYKEEDAEALLTYRLITGRKAYGNNNLGKPNIEMFCSRDFSYEGFVKKVTNVD